MGSYLISVNSGMLRSPVVKKSAKQFWITLGCVVFFRGRGVVLYCVSWLISKRIVLGTIFWPPLPWCTLY